MEQRTATTESNASHTRAGKAGKVALILVGVVALYGLVGAVLVPPIAKHAMSSQLCEKLGRAVEIE
jgi:hypothetical protein